MVQYQLVSHGIHDERVLKAMSEIPRHEFVPECTGTLYEDCPLPIGEEQTISQPYMVAIMTQCLELKGKEKILEIGTGSVYQAAVLSRLVDHVYTIERHEDLALKAKLFYKRRDVISGCHHGRRKSWTARQPFQGIIVTACAPHIPKSLIDQLEIDGRLVIPIGNPYNQVLYKIVKTGKMIKSQNILECAFVPLIGKKGWKME